MIEEYEKRLEDLRSGPWWALALTARERLRNMPEPEIARYLRSHFEAPVRDDDEITFRHSFDHALGELELLELAVATGYLPLEVAAAVAREDFDLLLSSPAARAYVENYDFIAVRFIAARLGYEVGRASVIPPPANAGASIRFAVFLTLHTEFIESEFISRFTRILDDYRFDGTVSPRALKAWLANPGYTRKVVHSDAARNVLEEGCFGFVEFVRILGDLFLQLATDERPLFGCVYSYWLGRFFGVGRRVGDSHRRRVTFQDVVISNELFAPGVHSSVIDAERARLAARIELLGEVWRETSNLLESHRSNGLLSRREVVDQSRDIQTLRMRRDMDIAAGAWESVIESCTKLVAAETGEAQISAVLQLVEACENVGRPNDAKAGLEIAYNAQPGNEAVRDRLKAIFEEEEKSQALARILIDEASKVEDENARFLMLRQAGELMLDEAPAAAAVALKQALILEPSDQAVNLLLVEAYIASKQQDEADAILDAAIESMKGRRSPELCVLQYRKAAVAGAVGNLEQQLHWLKEAHDTDRNNGDVAVELAALAEKLEDYDLAIRVLRSIALMEAAPVSRAVAYLRQGHIAERRGDHQKAVQWVRKALEEDPGSVEAAQFLKLVGK